MQLQDIPFDDQATFDLLSRGETTGIFQLSSSGMQGILRRMRPESLADIAIVLALFRPGVLNVGGVELYLRRRNGAD